VVDGGSWSSGMTAHSLHLAVHRRGIVTAREQSGAEKNERRGSAGFVRKEEVTSFIDGVLHRVRRPGMAAHVGAQGAV
jgi:hypothetical protein